MLVAYIHQADIYCESCGQGLVTDLMCEGYKDDGDSDTFPQGPYDNGGGEADSPQHCGMCQAFLFNPLTAYGVEYVRQKLALYISGDDNPNEIDWGMVADRAQEDGRETLAMWAEYYSDVLK